MNDTSLINGVIIDKEIAHPGMPKSISNAKIALLDVALEIEKTETDARIEITAPNQMQEFLQQEERTLKEMVDKVAKSGANVVFTQKGIDDVAQHFMAKAGIMAVRRVKKSDIEKLARATKAKDSDKPGRPVKCRSWIGRHCRRAQDQRRADGIRREMHKPEERDHIHTGRHAAGSGRSRALNN